MRVLRPMPNHGRLSQRIGRAMVMVCVSMLPLAVCAQDNAKLIPGEPVAASDQATVSVADLGHPASLRLLDGTQNEATLLSISKGVLQWQGNAQTPWDQVRDIVFEAAAPNTGHRVGIYLEQGELWANAIICNKKTFTFSWPSGENVELPVSLLTGFLLPGDHPYSEHDLDLWQQTRDKASRSASDHVLAFDKKQRLQIVPGVFLGLDHKLVHFSYQDKARSLPRSRVMGVLLAGLGKESKELTKGAIVTFHDKSRLRLSRLTLNSGILEGGLLAYHRLAIDMAEVASITALSDRLQWLSQVVPKAVTEKTLLAPQQSWQADRNTRRQMMRIAGKTYTSGIGVHADSRLTYAVPEGFAYFKAEVGVDDVGRRGDCHARVLLDGKPVFEKHLKAGESPITVSIPLANAKQLTLEVIQGDGLDLGDYVNWVDARLLK